MRIGFFTDTFLPTQNGVVTSIESFGSELARRGHEVHLFCPRFSERRHAGMHVHSVPSLPFPPYPEYSVGIPSGRTPRLDIVHTHGPFSMGWWGLYVARRQGIPKVSTYHTLFSEFVRYVSRFGEPLFKRASWGYSALHYRKYDRLIAPSNVIRRLLRERIDVPTEVVPTGIDTKFFRPVANARKKLGLDARRIYLCLGRLSYEKNTDVVLRAARSFLGEDDLLVIVGRGPAMASLQKQAGGAGNVVFTGYVPDEKVPLYYSAADALLTASTCETQGLVLLEAMACGCPVIGARSLAIPEVIDDARNGSLFRPGSSTELAAAVRRFRPSQGMRRAALRTAQDYTIEKCTKKLEKLYGELV